MSNLRLEHEFTHFRDLGGVQSLLRLHHAVDARHGVESTFCAFFEPQNCGVERVRGLGLTGYSSIRTARRRFQAAPPPAPDVVNYHNFWGLPFFADLDRAGRRIGLLHSPFPGLPGWLRHLRGLLDGVLCVSQPLLDLVRRELPELAGGRSAWLPLPVARQTVEAVQAPLAGRPLVLGFCGRLCFDPKRVDRLPALAGELDRAGVSFRLEFLGEGPQADWLRRRFAGDARVRFHGRLSGDAYWAALRGWDVMVFVSEYEGLPLALLEGLSVGVLPLFPAVGSGGDAYAAGVRDDLLYPSGNMTAAAAAVRSLAMASETEVRELRQRAQTLVKPHLGESYGEAFARQVRAWAALPRISRATFSRIKLRAHTLVPFGILRRLWPGGFWRCVG